MRKYYSEISLSGDNRALLSLLCSDDVIEALAKKVVAQLAERIALTGKAPTLENGARVVVKGITLTELKCPNCDNGILKELRSSLDKMFACSNCGHGFAFGDLSSDLKKEIIANLENITERLDAIYAEINAIKLQLKDVTPQQIADKAFELAGNYFEDKVVVSEQTLAQYLNSHI